jgi:hypothetical protein
VRVILTVSTVKDTLEHVRRFVDHNLAGGVDHLVILLDAPDPEVEAYLRGHAHVTLVVADEGWWRGDRPLDLNVRQRINANVVKAALTTMPWAEWLFHVDGDEVVWIAREALAKVPAGREAVRLAPLEAVARVHWDGDPTSFKRLLTDDELADLVAAGALTQPRNAVYFHGHPYGKSGMRPRLDRWLTLHDVVDQDRQRVAGVERPRLRMLHYESYDGREFARKWSALLGSGAVPSFRSVRQRTADRIAEVLDRRLDREATEAALLKVFRETTQDDAELLASKGLLVQTDPKSWVGVPQPLPQGGATELAGLLERLGELDKRVFHPGEPAEAAARMLDRATSRRSWWRR